MDSNQPTATVDSSGGSNRFVILRHTVDSTVVPTAGDGSRPQRGDHFDLMLEHNDKLWTWAMTSLPVAGQSQEVDRLPDHRLMYLTYEGPISDNRGAVRRVFSGRYELLEHAKHSIVVKLNSNRKTWHLRIENNGGAVWIRCEQEVPPTNRA